MDTNQRPVGTWVGTAQFRLMPTDPFDTGPSAAVSQCEAGVAGWTLRYTWLHPSDGPQAGVLLIDSPEPGATAVTVAWLDSWHQQPAMRVLPGEVNVSGMISCEAEYAPGWRWRIELHPDVDRLQLTMHNLVPERDGEPAVTYVVMDAVWKRG